MNRRKPRLDVAVVPMAEGEDRASAVLRKAVAAGLASLGEQGAAHAQFAAGYLAGYARHQALKHGVDAERDGGAALLAALAAQAPDAVKGLHLVPRKVPSSRAALAATDMLADAGYLVGHLESLCGTRRLLDTAVSVEAYLTACDHAADRLQTHHPTAVLRFDPAERAIVESALARL